jgi:hypothetical protein
MREDRPCASSEATVRGAELTLAGVVLSTARGWDRTQAVALRAKIQVRRRRECIKGPFVVFRLATL